MADLPSDRLALSPPRPSSPHELDLSFQHPPSPSDTEQYNRSPTFRRNYPGRLHLTPCSYSEYLDLPHCPEDQYEFIEGLLYYREMPDKKHQQIVAYCLMRMQARSSDASQTKELEVIPSASIELPDSSAGVSSPVADVAARLYTPGETTGAGPSASSVSKAFYPLNEHPPDVVIEVTSSNRNKDLSRNVYCYQRRSIRSYVIVDRQKDCVLVYNLSKETKKYNKDPKVYEGKAVIGSHLLKEMKITADELLHPPISTHAAAKSPVKRVEVEKRKVEDEKRKVEAELSPLRKEVAREKSRADKAEAEISPLRKEVAREKSRADKAEAEIEKLRAQLEASNISQSWGSSSSGSKRK